MTMVTRCSCFFDQHGLLSEVKPSSSGGCGLWGCCLLHLLNITYLCSLSLTELLYTEPAGVLCSWRMKKAVWGCCCCSVAQLCLTVCDPMDCRTPGVFVPHNLPEFAQIHVHWVCDAIQPSRPLLFPCLPAFNLSQHQGLFKWVDSGQSIGASASASVLPMDIQWIFRVDFL